MNILFKCFVKPSVDMKKYGLNLQYNINYFVNDENRLLVSENVSPILFDDYIFEKIEFSERKFDVGDTVIVDDNNLMYSKDTVYVIEHIDLKNNICSLKAIHSYDTRKANILELRHAFYYWYINDRGKAKSSLYGIDLSADEYRKKSSNLYDSLKDAKKHII